MPQMPQGELGVPVRGSRRLPDHLSELTPSLSASEALCYPARSSGGVVCPRRSNSVSDKTRGKPSVETCVSIR